MARANEQIKKISFGAWLGGLLQLTKPTIVLSFTLTGATAMVMEGSLLLRPFQFVVVLLGLFATAGSANAFNQYLEREIDGRMKRTAKRRPLPQGLVTPPQALWFSILMGVTGVGTLSFVFNELSGFIALVTILFYSFFYTLFLKPRTPYNIVIGGAAGATAPLIGWAAATGTLSWQPWWLFLLVFMWTPPHFWSLALNIKEDYAEVGIPMLPVAKGDAHTQNEIWVYSLLMAGLTYLPYYHVGRPYLVGATILNGLWLMLAWKLKRENNRKNAASFFGYSILYLMALFILLMV